MKGMQQSLLGTGESIVSVASSASVLYYEDIVTYSDNRSEPIEIIARPVPVFKKWRQACYAKRCRNLPYKV